MKTIKNILFNLFTGIGICIVLVIAVVSAIASYVVSSIFEMAGDGLYHAILFCSSLSFKKEKRILLHSMKRIHKNYTALSTIPLPGDNQVLINGEAEITPEIKLALEKLSLQLKKVNSISKIRRRLLLGKKLNSYVT